MKTKDFLNNKLNNNFKFHNIDKSSFNKIIDKMKPQNSSGVDGMSVYQCDQNDKGTSLNLF